MSTIQKLLMRGIQELYAAGIDGAPRDARLLMADALGIASDRLTLHSNDSIDPENEARFRHWIEARCRRKPVSKIIGRRMFFGRKFVVNSDVLDPRPETETLIKVALAKPFRRLLDLGTGSGAILNTLLAEDTDSTGVGTDISDAAIAVAAQNATQIGVSSRATFQRADWWQGVTGKFDLIVSNPPYIAKHELNELSSEVRNHDPHLALTDGADGLQAYKEIIAPVRSYLLDQGRLIVEIGPTQAADVSALCIASGLNQVMVHHDMDGRDRVISAVKLP